MKKVYLMLALLSLTSLTAFTAQADVGVSVSIGQPGFYGQIDVGDYYPRPDVIYERPRIIHIEPAYQYARPVYLRVPPGHAKRWSSHCGYYNACGRPVYFVQDGWYQNVYAPRYQSYRRYGDDGHRYDHDYWDKHGGRGNSHGHKGKHKHGRGHD